MQEGLATAGRVIVIDLHLECDDGVLSGSTGRLSVDIYPKKKTLHLTWAMALDYQTHNHVSKPLLSPPNSFQQGSFYRALKIRFSTQSRSSGSCV